MLNSALSNTLSSWRSILNYDPDTLRGVFSYLEELSALGERIIPDTPNIFTFAQYPLSEIRLVIIGQDPYPAPASGAHGLAFSSTAQVCPKSLSVIFNAINHLGLFKRGKPTTWELSSWAQQGVLLLNTSLTTKAFAPNAHLSIWRKYMRGLIQTLDLYFHINGKEIPWMLWGKNAQQLPIKYGKRLEWCHPVAMVRPSFVHCPHFAEVCINWDLNETKDPINWYTDGACKNNQVAHLARAGWGVISTDLGITASGNVQCVPVKYKDNIVDARPTSQRAEGLALINCFKAIWRSGVRGVHIVNTDSQFWLDMIINWMPKWVERGIPWHEKKNSDLTYQCYHWWLKVRQFTPVHLRKVQAHHDYVPTPETQADHVGNMNAEQLAESAI